LEIALHHRGTGSTILAVARFAEMHKIEQNLSRVSLSIYVIAKLLSKWNRELQIGCVVSGVYLYRTSKYFSQGLAFYFLSWFRRDVNRAVWEEKED